VARAVPYTYEDNVCTHSYSYVWYGEKEWTEHIDWMALQGVNVFLAMAGQEEIQYKAFQKFGMDDREIREFFNGPAYLTCEYQHRGALSRLLSFVLLPRVALSVLCPFGRLHLTLG
jgi:hypothetical protein